jgi:hypothetical protein
VVICGFGDVGQAVANMLAALGQPYVAFDLTVPRVQAAQAAGFNVLYGDGTRLTVLQAAGVGAPRAVVVGYQARGRAVAAVAALRGAFPGTRVLARAIDLAHAADLEEAGASEVVCAESEAGVAVGSRLALGLGAGPSAVAALASAMRDDMATRSHQWAEEKTEGGALPARRPVYQFDGANAQGPWTGGAGAGAGGSVGGSLSSGSIDDEAASSILANIGQSIRTAMSAEDAARAAAGAGDDACSALAAADGGDRLVTISKEGECITLPDGSMECPITWETDAVTGVSAVVPGGGAGSRDKDASA